MKFLSKRADSKILKDGLVYKPNGDNHKLRELLLAEQSGFCAYTEQRVGLHHTNIEHFDPKRKEGSNKALDKSDVTPPQPDSRPDPPKDGYYNYYAVLTSANQRKRKKERKHDGAEFFASRFFQTAEKLRQRIRYVPGEHVYEEVERNDAEVMNLIDYLGFNDERLVNIRKRHVERLRGTFTDLDWDRDKRLAYLAEYPDELSFITAIEATLTLQLDELLTTEEGPESTSTAEGTDRSS